MTPANPLRRLPARLRPFAYVLGALLVLLLLWQWLFVERPDFGELPDFAAIEDVAEMKSAFYAYLTPIINHHNEMIRQQRARLRTLQQRYADDKPLSSSDRRWLRELAAQYELDWGEDDPRGPLLQRLLMRVDTIPVELALAQAAKESGWGRSRFAVEANNLFGQWCYTEGCGKVPAKRAEGATHEVEEFSSVSEAMRRYMNNLNTHDSYSDFRRLRSELRASGKPLSGTALASGLILYSERREAYVDELRAMIEQYRRMQATRSSA